MSRGPGKIQRRVTRLLADEPDSAWTIGGLAEIVYEVEPEKKHRVALLRMLKTAPLPGTWRLWFDKTNPAFLCDPCNDNSMLQRMALDRGQGLGGVYHVSDLNDYSRTLALKEASDARRWRDASQSERIEIDIEYYKKQLGLFAMYCPERAKLVAKHIVKLQAELQELNVS
jgi:hypothetical protein